MKVLMDTSVLLSAMLSDHVHHPQARSWIEYTKTDAAEWVVSGHSLAELYSVLTRLPRTPRISPAEALSLIHENLVPHASIVTLAAGDYLALIDQLAQVGVTGGAVYDAVIARAAEIAGVDYLITLNVSHFQRVWPNGGSRIVSPQTTAPPKR
jgi:predicted nucleic acid-binding protein